MRSLCLMDPLSITAAALGITQIAVISINQLRQTIGGIAEADRTLEDIQLSLTNIQRPLDVLNTLTFPDDTALADIKANLQRTGVAEAVNHCGEACERFDRDIQRWTKNSGPGKLTFRDRFTVGVWKAEKIRTFQTLLQSCQTTVQIAVQSSQLLLQLRSEATSTSTLTQLASLEAAIQAHLAAYRAQSVEAQKLSSALQARAEDPAADEEEDERDLSLAVREVRARAGLLDTGAGSASEILAQLADGRSRQSICDVRVADESRALVGMTQASVGRVDQQIAGVVVEEKSGAAIGVFGGSLRLGDMW